jgi:O-antigen ligase/cytochrome c-type biogenesis protein CcmH/NrfG
MAPPNSSPRAAVWEWGNAGLLGVSLVWTTLCLGGYRPETMVVTVWLNALLLVSVLLAAALREGGPVPHPAGWLLLPFFAYAAVNASWLSPVGWLGWHDWLLWAQAGGVFWVVLNGTGGRAQRDFLLGVVVVLGVVAVGMAAYQRWVDPEWLMLGRRQAPQFFGRSSGPFGIPNSLAALLLLLLPPALAVGLGRTASPGRRMAALGLAALFAYGLFLTISRGAWLGLALALAAWPLLVRGRSLAGRLAISGGILAGLIATGVALYQLAPGVRLRMDQFVADGGERTRPIMWRIAWSIFREHPATGGGAGSYNVLLEKFRPENFQDDAQWAHNDYLNTLSDYGLVGFVLLFGAAAVIAGRCVSLRRTEPEATAELVPSSALGIGLLAFALQLFVDFHFKIPALGMACALVAAILVRRRWPAAALAGNRLRFFALVAAAVVVGLTTLRAVPHFRAEGLRYGVRRDIDAFALGLGGAGEEQSVVMAALPSLRRAVALDPTNAQAWADLAYAVTLTSHFETGRNNELGAEAEQAARRAIALAPVVPEFRLRLGVALDLQGRWSDAGAAFNQALELAPNSATAWFYQAYHFSIRSNFHKLAEAAVATCLRLDPSRRDAEALRQRLAAPH